jgi:hypothetical protein
MKILFWFDWDDTYLLEKVIKNIQDKHESGFEYCAFVTGPEYYEYYINKYPNKKDNLYLTSQININAKNEKLNEDEIDRIELEYGQYVHRYILADRHMKNWDHNNSLKYIQESFRFIECVYKKENYDMVIWRGTSACGLNSMVEYFCMKNNIPIRAISFTRLVESSIYISDNSFENTSDIISKFNELILRELSIKENDVSDKLIQKQRGGEVYWSKFNNKITLNDLYSEVLSGFKKVYKYYNKNKLYKKYEEHSKVSIFGRISGRIVPKIKKIIYQKLLKFEDVANLANKNYYYFPLHVVPEATTMTLAPSYLDQMSLIRDISNAIPGNSTLIVKEHPAMLGKRELSAYKEIKKNNNVKLVSMNVSSSDLIKYSQAVITITGTSGMEAIFMKKPVITFGKTSYNFFPYVENIRTVRDMPKTVKKILNYDWDKYDFYLKRFVLSIDDCSKSGFSYEPGIDYSMSLADKNIENISNALNNKIVEYENSL